MLAILNVTIRSETRTKFSNGNYQLIISLLGINTFSEPVIGEHNCTTAIKEI